MTNNQTACRTVAVVAVSLLLTVALALDVQARGRSHGLPGTWFYSVPSGRVGFNTYNQDGTMTGVTSTIFGAPPHPAGVATNASADHGTWRRVKGGFEAAVFRIVFDPVSGDPVTIVRIRTYFAFEPGRDSTSGTFLVDQWVCPTALTCPDPNSTPPDVADISPPPPFNTVTQTRVRRP